MTNLNELHYFAEVARTLSFTSAATRLGVPKSSVSRAIASLERRLGVRLLERTTRRIVLTEVGEVYLRHCQRVVEEATEADVAISSLGGQPRGLLRVAANMTFARTILAPSLSGFLNSHPDLRISLVLQGGPIDPIQANVDVAIQLGPVTASALMVRQLGMGRLGIYASPAYIARHGLPGSPQELQDHACSTTAESGAGAVWTLRSEGETVEVRHKPRISVADPVVQLNLALDGAVISMAPDFMAHAAEASGRLVRVLPEWEPTPIEIFALYPSRLSMTPKLRVFLDYLLEEMRRFALTAATRDRYRSNRAPLSIP